MNDKLHDDEADATSKNGYRRESSALLLRDTDKQFNAHALSRYRTAGDTGLT